MTDGEEPTPADAYDELAETYREEAESNPYNADLEFPGTTGLVPEVAGERVLDAGCGAGRYTEWLLDRGAEVVGADASAEMLDRARERVADRPESQREQVTFHRADLADPLDFAGDEAFDGIVSSLVLDYVEDWRGTFSEFARVLKPGGFLVFSVRHPLDEHEEGGDGNYFAVERREADWAVEVPYYRRPLSEMVNPLADAGFGIAEIAEPRPTERFRDRLPDRYEQESRNPVFLCVRAVKE